ncbi:RPII140-upstream gene protein-like isoform X2 [Gordionus sp. m RMFG-2023]|uniref:RPII140-upstream gene protein-like isoform X2 n=1 Tax=Gordionus sp. m RMFG-2023 TaxID=3053472 RepID=UPI0031FC9DB4
MEKDKVEVIFDKAVITKPTDDTSFQDECFKIFGKMKSPFINNEEEPGLSPALLFISKTTFTAYACVFIWSFLLNKNYYKTRFLDRNQITLFESNIQAKRKLMDNMILDNSLHASRQAMKNTFFLGSMLFGSFAISGYREKHCASNFAMASGIVGALTRIKLGMRGMLVAGGLATVLGYIGGNFIILLLKTKNTNLEDYMKERKMEYMKKKGENKK